MNKCIALALLLSACSVDEARAPDGESVALNVDVFEDFDSRAFLVPSDHDARITVVDDADARRAKYEITPNGVINGSIGPLAFTNEPAELVRSTGLTAKANGRGADGVMFVWSGTFDGSDVDAMLADPGTYEFFSNDLGSALLGMACTVNEGDDVDHFDEVVDTVIVVDAPDSAGQHVVINQLGAEVDVSVDATIEVQ